MKATATKQPAAFEPVELKIVFESQEELDEFYALFDLVPVCRELKSVSHRQITDALSGQSNADHVIYDKHFTRIRDGLKAWAKQQ